MGFKSALTFTCMGLWIFASSKVFAANQPAETTALETPQNFVPLREHSFGVSAGLDVLGPATWQLFVRPWESTNRVVDRQYLSYSFRVHFDTCFATGCFTLRPLWRVVPPFDRNDAREFTETSLEYVHATSIRADGYGIGGGWIQGPLDDSSSWWPWFVINYERSLVRLSLWLGDDAASSKTSYAVSSTLDMIHGHIGMTWIPFENHRHIRLMPSVMIPLVALAQPKKTDEVENSILDELQHRATTAVGIALALTL